MNIERFNKSFDLVYKEIVGEVNDKQTREKVKNILEKDFGEEFTIQCDEAINSPSIIDDNKLIALIYNNSLYCEMRFSKYPLLIIKLMKEPLL